MPTPLNILIVEDSPTDAELALAELHRAGFDPKWKRVETEADFLAEIKKSPDIILSDYVMPEFSGLRAAELLRATGLDIPFILISGAVGEEAAVAAMQLGATDYLLKDRLVRLGSAVERALEEKRLRDERKLAEEAMQESQALYHSLVDQLPAGVFRKDAEGRFVFVSPWFCQLKGMKKEEFLGKTAEEAGVSETAKRDPEKRVAKYASQGGDHHRRIMETGQAIDT